MAKDRFEFGKNWAKFLNNLTDEKIKEAEKSLKEWLGMDDLTGKTFLDIGSGSGLFSLAARNLGATVSSFDYDINSVNCTKTLKERYYPNDNNWHVEQGDALSKEYLAKYDKYDIVYSWGVLHHTGNMYLGLENASEKVKDHGTLFIAIYNDQGRESRTWTKIKKAYVNWPKFMRIFLIIPCFIKTWGPATIYDFTKGRPFHTWRTYNSNRGMTPWIDFIDWIGGYPFEVAKPEEIFDFFHKKGFDLDKMATEGKSYGCNQFVFKR